MENPHRHFQLFGFAVLRGLLTQGEIRCLRAEVEGGLRDAYGTRFGENTRDDMPADDANEVAAEGNFLPLMADRTPFSQGLVADDGRLSEFAEAVLGDYTVASPALAAMLVADTPWHNDPGTGDRWVRFNAYLQPATAGTGALRVVPASQHAALSHEIGEFLKSGSGASDNPASLPGVAVETRPGDVIAFDPRVHHGAWGGARRLRWSVDFVALPRPSDGVAMASTRALIEELSDWPSPDRWPPWAEWAAGSAERRKTALAKLRLLGVL